MVATHPATEMDVKTHPGAKKNNKAGAPDSTVAKAPSIVAQKRDTPIKKKPILAPTQIFVVLSSWWLITCLAYLIGVWTEISLTVLPLHWYVGLVFAVLFPIGLGWMALHVTQRNEEFRAISESFTSLATRISSPDVHAIDEVAAVGKAVQRELDVLNTAMGSMTSRLNELEDTTQKQIEAVESASGRAEKRAQVIRDALVQERESLTNLTETLGNGADIIIEAVEEQIARLKSTTDNASKEIGAVESELDRQVQTFRKTVEDMAEGSRSAVQEIDRQTSRLEEVSEAGLQRTSVITARYDQQREVLQETIDRLGKENERVDQTLDGQREFLNRATQVVSEQSVRLEGAINQAAQQFEDTYAGVVQRTHEAGEQFKKEAVAMSAEGGKATEAIAKAAQQASIVFRDKTSGTIDAIVEETKQKFEESYKTVASNARKVGEQFVAEAQSAVNLSQEASQAIVKAAEQSGATFRARTNESVEAARAAAKSITAAAVDAAEKFRVKTDAAAAAGDEVAGLFVKAANDASKKIAGEAETIKRIGADVAQDITASLSQAKETASQVRGELSEEMTNTARSIASVTSAANKAATTLEGRIQKSAHAAKSLVGAFESSTKSVDAVRGKYETTLSAIETQIQGLSERLQSVSDEIEKRISSMPDLASSASSKVRDAVAEELDKLYDVAEDISSKAEALEAAVKARRESLIELHLEENSESGLSFYDRPPSVGAAEPDSDNQDISGASIGPAPLSMSSGHEDGREDGNFWKSIFAKIDEDERREEEPVFGEPTPSDHFQKATLHVVEALQAMAIDIDRLLEEDPPVDLWKRYQNGEKNVFARRLASLRGDDMHNRIRKKYDEDPEFREHADEYVRKFDGLLKEAVARDRENILAETYLTSHTGKVYLMLGQAIGHFN